MGKKVLIADDEVHIRRILELKIKGAGYEVRGCTDGASAFEAAKAFVPDLVVTDFRMPGDMSGVDLIRAIRQTTKIAETPIILLTGSLAVVQQLSGSLVDVDGVTLMSKPFSPRNLVKQIEEILKERDATESGDD